MSREIKFRFWNQIAKRFQPAGKYAIDGNGKLISYEYEGHYYDRPVDLKDTCIIPQQCIGLKDKNGKEIYEGDIIEYDRHGKIRGEVYFEQNGCEYIFGEGYALFKKMEKYITVIGNMFENKELL
jgi:uncharacterized phage protein (TIGR01671 family)